MMIVSCTFLVFVKASFNNSTRPENDILVPVLLAPKESDMIRGGDGGDGGGE